MEQWLNAVQSFLGFSVQNFSNKELMDKAGLEAPTSIWLYERLYASRGLKEAASPPLKLESLITLLKEDLNVTKKQKQVAVGVR